MLYRYIKLPPCVTPKRIVQSYRPTGIQTDRQTDRHTYIRAYTTGIHHPYLHTYRIHTYIIHTLIIHTLALQSNPLITTKSTTLVIIEHGIPYSRKDPTSTSGARESYRCCTGPKLIINHDSSSNPNHYIYTHRRLGSATSPSFSQLKSAEVLVKA